MISIDRLEEMAIEELQTELKNFKEQIKLQNNFIDSLLKATNNSEWLDKSMLDDEVSEVIEKIELDYAQLDQLKADREEALKQLEFVRTLNTVKEAENRKLSKTLAEIKEIAEEKAKVNDWLALEILQKISEVVE